MVVGFFGYGYTSFVETHGEIGTLVQQVANPVLVKATAFAAPLLAIAGGAMARSLHQAAGALLALATVAVYAGFGFNVFTMFPIGMCALAAVLAFAARQPDAH